MGRRLKSQVAMEFIMFISLAFMIMIVFAVVTRNSMLDLREEEEFISLTDVINSVHTEIRLANTVEDGYVRNFTIPLTLEGIEYNITSSEGYLFGESRNHEYAIDTLDFQGSVIIGQNQIRRINGTVYLN